MKRTLLIATCGAVATLASKAHQVDPYTIFYDETELVTAANPKGWDPNGDVPPQPEADFYINMQNASNVYYRLEPVAGFTPAVYTCHVPALQGNFKIYAKEYWTKKDSGNRNSYIYGSRNEPTGFLRDTYKELGNPGGDLQIEGGGTWYGCTLEFWPSGHTGSGIPELKITGGVKDSQNISVEASGRATGTTTGEIDYTIHTGGLVKPELNNYDIVVTYTDADGKKVEMKTTQKGLQGTVTGISNLAQGETTDFELSASVVNAAYFNDISNPDKIAGYKDFSATTTTTITTVGDQKPSIYLIGNISGSEWAPLDALEGTYLESDAAIIIWRMVPFTGEKRFRFVSQRASWDVLNSEGSQYYPSSTTQLCANYYAESPTWYSAIEGKQTDNAWTPDFPSSRSTNEVSFDVLFDTRNNHIAVGWLELTGVEDIESASQGDAPVDVFTTTGVLVRHGADPANPADGLTPGLYIAGGRKFAVM